MHSQAIGEVELENNVLVIRRIHVRLRLKAAEKDQDTARRVHGFFAEKCPIYLTLKPAIEMTTELEIEPATASE